jgi:hypothetical protein
LAELRRKLGPTDCLVEDTRAWRLERCATIVLGVIPSASSQSVYPRLALVPVATLSIEGSSSVHVGANPLDDGLGLVASLGVSRLRTTTKATFFDGGWFLALSVSQNRPNYKSSSVEMIN